MVKFTSPTTESPLQLNTGVRRQPCLVAMQPHPTHRDRALYLLLLLTLGALACQTRGQPAVAVPPGADAATNIAAASGAHAASGCYVITSPRRSHWWQLPDTVELRSDRGAYNYEARGMLVRPRGGYRSAYWQAVGADSIVIHLNGADSDSDSRVVAMAGTEARAAVHGDSLIGVADWVTDFGSSAEATFRAHRVRCASR
jgi:hypothetical protein